MSGAIEWGIAPSGPWKVHPMTTKSRGYDIITDWDCLIASTANPDVARAIAEVPAMVAALRQYRDDMKYPPSADSRERRIAMVDAILARIDGK